MDLTQVSTPLIYMVFLGGLVLLFAGGHFLVDGSSKLSAILGISPIVAGLTIVALGTSMPEFVVSMFAAISGKTDVALGNIIGSNVSNLGLILGVSAMARPIAVNKKLLKFEIPLVVGVSATFWLLCANALLSRLDGAILFVGFVCYLYLVVTRARKDTTPKSETQNSDTRAKKTPQVLLIIGGIVGLSFGADFTVDAASEISRRIGVSELVLGLTIVALGTSLPELATSLVAAVKKQGDISIGNIIGSNIFNMMAIAGPSAMANPLPVSDIISNNHLPVMMGLTIFMVPLISTGKKLGRIEGIILAASYFGIMYWWIQ